ncbi:MAG: aldolase catalytic domain-containing protein [Acidobacteriota bacterium]
MQTSKIELLDCTIRDGGYVNDWFFDKGVVREVYRALSKAGIDWVELGYRDLPGNFDGSQFGPWRFSDEQLIKETTEGIYGSKIALMVDFGRITKNDIPDADRSVVKLIRMAAHKNNLEEACIQLSEFKEKGYLTSLNAMGVTSFDYEDRLKTAQIISKSDLDYFYVVDSYGSLFPNQIAEVLKPFLDLDGVYIGFHPHNSLQMALANTLEAINCGVHIVDSTIYGIGRGSGNLPTEALVAYLQTTRDSKYNVLPVLNCISKYFLDISQEFKWGYQLPYLLSGIFQCHPNYAKKMIGLREYTVEDMWKAMEIIKRRDVIGYSENVLNEILNSGLVGSDYTELSNGAASEAKEDVVPGPSVIRSNRRPQCSYVNRHEGRDFLVLANGPTLKTDKALIEEFIKKYDPIILGANYLGGLFVPHYHACNNKKRFPEYITNASKESNLLIGQYIPENMIGEYTKRDYELLCYRDVVDAPFEIIDGVIQTNCRTISTLLLGVAIVMGAKRVFSAGMDGYIGADSNGSIYFYDTKDEITDDKLAIELHRWCERFLKQIDDYLVGKGKEGVHIITPTSYSSFYKRIDNYI